MTVHGSSGTSERVPRPSDLDLMLYADGELEGEQLAAVEAWLASDREARAKLLGLGLVSGMIRERALGASAGADGIADAVMDRVATKVDRRARRRAANVRSMYVVGAAVLAVAAAVLLWSRPASHPGGAPLAHHTATEPEVAAPAIDVDHPGGRPRASPDDPEHGVEVSAVDFGSRTGAVFYVPTGTSASDTTTVVWLSDDSAGEDE